MSPPSPVPASSAGEFSEYRLLLLNQIETVQKRLDTIDGKLTQLLQDMAVMKAKSALIGGVVAVVLTGALHILTALVRR